MSDDRPVVTVDGVPVGRLTDFHLRTDATGPVHTIPVPDTAAFLPGQITVPVGEVAVCDPFAPKAPPQNPRPNRAQRRARRKG